MGIQVSLNFWTNITHNTYKWDIHVTTSISWFTCQIILYLSYDSLTSSGAKLLTRSLCCRHHRCYHWQRYYDGHKPFLDNRFHMFSQHSVKSAFLIQVEKHSFCASQHVQIEVEALEHCRWLDLWQYSNKNIALWKNCSSKDAFVVFACIIDIICVYFGMLSLGCYILASFVSTTCHPVDSPPPKSMNLTRRTRRQGCERD